MKQSSNLSRRDFLKSAGALTVTFSMMGGLGEIMASQISLEDLPGSLRRYPQVNAWLEILANGRVRIFSGKVELGQGIRIAIRQVAAEELYIEDFDLVEVVLAETGRTPDEGYTAGSGSIQSSAMAVRYAAAYAREKLLSLAAEKFQASPEKLETENGIIYSPGRKDKITFADLLTGKQIEETVTLPVKLKPKDSYHFVGKAVKRQDMQDMVQGKSFFIHDLRFPEMVFARVLRPVNYQSELLEFDEAGFKKAVPNLVSIVRDGNFIGVAGKSSWEAEKAIRKLKNFTQWSEPAIFPDENKLYSHLKEIAEAPEASVEKGDRNQNIKSSLKASYRKPYNMHASMGPASAVAMYDSKILHIWSHSQGIYPMRRAIASMLEMPEENIHIVSVPGAGCFGHTVADDAAADAAVMAMELPGKHVQVQWSREDEHQWEPYGSAMIMELEAGLDSEGKIDWFQSDIWTDSHSTRPNKEAATVLTARHLSHGQPLKGRGYTRGGVRNADPYYNLPYMKVNGHYFDGPLRVSSLRSLGAFANIFALESFMDQLAEKAGEDPVEFRLKHLDDDRAKDVLRKVREMVATQKTGKNQGIGYAFCRYKNYAAYCAMAAMVTTDPQSGEIVIDKIWTAVDVGEVINADGIRNQTEGGIIQAASWTLMESVSFDQQRITSKGWATYPIFAMKHTPEVEVEVIDRPDQDAMGGGEASVPPVAAAIANAVYQACGQRLYDLPLKLSV